MEFTGERLVPGAEGLEDLYLEHMSRYVLAEGLVAGKRVLDVGCGCGYGAHYLALSGAGEVVGVDISQEAVEYAAARYAYPGLTYRVMDCRRLPAQQPYDLITCFELIEHVDDDRAAVDSLAAALSEDGLCLISTPNADTYVAGGEGGSNPFHCREYRRDEFERLLRTRFAGVRLLEQRWVDAMLISPAAGAVEEATPSRGASSLLPADTGASRSPESFGPASYFVAICGKSKAAPELDGLPRPLVTCAPNLRYARLKEEYDSRGRWARKIDEEARGKDAIIRRLREEKHDLERRFDERGRWAQGLDAEIREKDELIEKLMSENDELRKAAAAR
jgi:SAM-dependent methyltransferase